MAVILSAAKNLRISFLRLLLLVSGATSFRVLIAKVWGIGRSPTAVLFLILAASPRPAQAQGCAQCRETLGQTPVHTQQAYRRAITLMVLSGATVFTGAFIALRRFR